MLRMIHRPAATAMSLLLIASLFTFAAPSAAASDGQNNKEEARPVEKKEAQPETGAAAPQTLNITYALYNNPIKLVPEPVAETTKPASATKPGAPAVSTAPMTAGEKFNYFLRRTILSPGAYGQSIASGMFNELLDNNEGKKDTLDDFFADSMTRAARSMAFKITAGFFEKFAYATIFKQDPRYHRSDSRSVGGKIGYAVSRLFVTQGDRCGCDQFNISYLAGGLTASFIAHAWVREEHQNTSHAFRRWGVHMGITALSNILKEFLGGQ
jgi:hypothetical protein